MTDWALHRVHTLPIEFTVTDEYKVKQAYTQSPNATSNPLLYALLSQTLSICRTRNASILLTGFYGGYYISGTANKLSF